MESGLSAENGGAAAAAGGEASVNAAATRERLSGAEGEDARFPEAAAASEKAGSALDGEAGEGDAASEEEEEGSDVEEESDGAAGGHYEGDTSEVLAELLRKADAYTAQITGGLDTYAAAKPKKAQLARSHLLSEKEEDDRLIKAAEEGEETDPFVRVTVQPDCITGTMKAYQIEGLNWLYQLYRLNINGILADEMGLGKTLQTISLLGFLKFVRGVDSCHLVICPRSTLDNWYCEISRWCPQLRAVRLHGSKETRDAVFAEHLQEGTFDLCVTTYEMVIKEKSRLSTKYNWEYLIMDEAHRIKNEKSILADVVRKFRPKHRLLITGTPLQNNLRELWSLLNFIMPQLFESSANFEGLFDFSRLGSVEQQQQMIQTLHRVLRPFMLRRLKTDVAKDLPPKREIYIFVGMSRLQKKLYADILSKNLEVVNAMSTNKTQMLNILMQLRKCCNHPYLFDGVEPGPPYVEGYHIVEAAGKMHLLDKLLPRLKREGSRVLLFSQMTRLLDIVDDYCRWRNYAYTRIDGSTPGEERQQRIDLFNKEGSPLFLFLLSTRAGGLGINLATADVVILFDSDFNPQMDLQAMDRAHRIGQKKKVVVYRFVTGSTVEERIVERAAKKLKLDSLVIQKGRLSNRSGGAGSSHQGPNAAELHDILQFGAQEVYRTQHESSITEEDIDIILADAEQRTADIQAQLQSLESKFDLSNISLDGGLHMYGAASPRLPPGRPGRKKGSKALRPCLFLELGDRKTKWRGDAQQQQQVVVVRRERRLPRKMLTGWRGEISGGYDFQFFDAARLDYLDGIQLKWRQYIDGKRRLKLEQRLKAKRLLEEPDGQEQQGGDAATGEALLQRKRRRQGAAEDPSSYAAELVLASAAAAAASGLVSEEAANAAAAAELPASTTLAECLQSLSQTQTSLLHCLLDTFWRRFVGASSLPVAPQSPVVVQLSELLVAVSPASSAAPSADVKAEEGAAAGAAAPLCLRLSQGGLSFNDFLRRLAADLVSGRALSQGVPIAQRAAEAVETQLREEALAEQTRLLQKAEGEGAGGEHPLPSQEEELQQQEGGVKTEEGFGEEDFGLQTGEGAAGGRAGLRDATGGTASAPAEEEQTEEMQQDGEEPSQPNDEAASGESAGNAGTSAATQMAPPHKKRAGRPRKLRPPEPEELISDTESTLDDPTDPDRPEPFTAEMRREKEELLSRGFVNWNRTEFTKFVSALINFGKNRLEEAWYANFSGGSKTLEDFKKYAEVFFARYSEVEGGDRIMQRIEKAEELRGAIDMQRRAVQAAVEEQLLAGGVGSPHDLRLPPGLVRSAFFSEEDDKLILWGLYEHGVNAFPLVHAALKFYCTDSRSFFALASRSLRHVEERCREITAAMEAYWASKTGQGAELLRVRQTLRCTKGSSRLPRSKPPPPPRLSEATAATLEDSSAVTTGAAAVATADAAAAAAAAAVCCERAVLEDYEEQFAAYAAAAAAAAAASAVKAAAAAPSPSAAAYSQPPPSKRGSLRGRPRGRPRGGGVAGAGASGGAGRGGRGGVISRTTQSLSATSTQQQQTSLPAEAAAAAATSQHPPQQQQLTLLHFPQFQPHGGQQPAQQTTATAAASSGGGAAAAAAEVFASAVAAAAVHQQQQLSQSQQQQAMVCAGGERGGAFGGAAASSSSSPSTLAAAAAAPPCAAAAAAGGFDGECC